MSRCACGGSVLTRSGNSQELCARCLLATALDPGHAEVSNGELFGDYKIICEIGQGGMGIVYLAEQRRAMQREVALKVLKPGLDSAAVVRRFETERKALAMMEHPGIATLYDAGVSSLGRPYFVMEFVDGAPITAACDSRRASIPERLALIVEVCRAIDHAHRKGVVHRDIKPSNVLVTERDGRPSAKVIDFGVARAVSGSLTGNTLETVFGELLGTPEYMSPEQAGFETSKVGPASDTYSLGVLLYELTAGVLPFDPVKLRESGIAEAARKIREDDTPPPATRLRDNGLIDEIAGRRNIKADTLRRMLSGDLARVIAKCLDKDPTRRYPSSAALGDDIDRYLRRESVLAARPNTLYRARKWLRKHRAPAAIAAVVLAAAAFAYWISLGPTRTPLIVTPLTTYRGSESSPSFSPDAKEVAFAWNGEREDNWDIYRLRIGDTVPRRLTASPAAEYAPAWSPDGKWITYLEAKSDVAADLMLMPADGGPARRLIEARLNVEPQKRWITWSSDGKWLLLAHRLPEETHQRIFAISTATGERHALTNPAASSADADGQPSLSLDGKTLLYARDADTPGQLWTLPVTADLRPAGPERRIALTGFESKECGVPLAISATEFVFFAPVPFLQSIWRGRLSGGQAPRALPELGQFPMAMDVSRDRRRLVYSRQTYDSNIWRIDLDAPAGKEVRRERVLASTQWDENPSLAPDGTTIAFESNRGDRPEVWLASKDGSNARPLAPLSTAEDFPMWSPNGSEIAFQGIRNGKSAIFVVPSNGGIPREVSPDPAEATLPTWSPDGKWLYFCSPRGGSREIWRIPAQGGQPMRITQHGGYALAFSPDGRWIYYSRERAPSASIFRMPANGGDDSLVLESAIGGQVVATDRRLYFSTQQHESSECQIKVLDLTTGAIRTLARTERPIRQRPAVSRDERSIYFTQVDDDGIDLMLVSDFR